MNNCYLKDNFRLGLSSCYKVINFLIISGCCLFLNSWLDVFMVGIYLALQFLFTGKDCLVTVRLLARGGLVFVYVLFLGILFRWNLVMLLFKVLFLYFNYVIFLVSDSLEGMLYGLFFFKKRALDVVMAGRFLLYYDEEVVRIKKASKLRNLKIRITNLGNIFLDAISNSLDNIGRTKEIYEVKLYNYRVDRSDYWFTKWGIFDTIFIVVDIILVILVFVF